MSYDVRLARVSRMPGQCHQGLHFSVWEMSQIRNLLLDCGGAFDSDPSDAADAAPKGIAGHKLTYVDGWNVTRGEVQAALRAIEDHGLDVLDEPKCWKLWVDFLRDAEAGGFRIGWLAHRRKA